MGSPPLENPEPRSTADRSAPAIEDLTDFSPSVLRDLLALLGKPGYLTYRHLNHPGAIRVRPTQLYAACTALGLGLASLLGEANTGALYVFGGGVFDKLGPLGRWIGFLCTVPVLAALLRVARWNRSEGFRDYLVFSLHFESVVALGIGLETLLVAGLGATALAPFAAFTMPILVVIYFVLSIADAFGERIENALLQGLGAGLALMAVFIGVVVALAQLVGFRL